jgi:hypothetical protein
LRQKRSDNEYVILFERYRSRLNNFDDTNAVRFFRGGLKPELRQLVNNHLDIASDDINGLIALAERLDKMKINKRQYNRNHRKPNFSSPNNKEETFLQPMENDAVRAHSNTQLKSQRLMTKDETKKNDFTKIYVFVVMNLVT